FVENDISEFSSNVGGLVRFVQMTNAFSTEPTYNDYTVTVPQFLDAGFASIAQPNQPGGVPVAPQNIDSRMIDAAMQGNTVVAAQTVNTSFTEPVRQINQYTDRVRWYQFHIPDAPASQQPALEQTGDISPALRFPDASTYTPAIEISPSYQVGVTFL